MNGNPNVGARVGSVGDNVADFVGDRVGIRVSPNNVGEIVGAFWGRGSSMLFCSKSNVESDTPNPIIIQRSSINTVVQQLSQLIPYLR